MINGLEIKEANKPLHIDIEKDIERQGNGLFTFIIRTNNGNVVDYNVVEYADIRKYLVLKQVIVQEFTVTRHPHSGDPVSSIRSDNNQRPT